VASLVLPSLQTAPLLLVASVWQSEVDDGDVVVEGVEVGSGGSSFLQENRKRAKTRMTSFFIDDDFGNAELWAQKAIF